MSAPSSERSASASSSSASAHSLASLDGECVYQLACVETFLPLSKDITPVNEPTVSAHPVARIDYSPNFRFIYGLYRALRNCIEFTDAAAQQRVSGPSLPVIRAMHTSPARWLLLLGFALRQCTSNYTVWKDRRDVIMSPHVLRCCTRDALPPVALPSVLLSTDAADAAAKAKAVAEVKESSRKIEVVAEHWLPGPSDLYVGDDGAARASATSAVVSPWRAVRWELEAVGCFTRLYHKNFQVWHHRRELLSYALQHTIQPAPAVHADHNSTSIPDRTPDAADDQCAAGVLSSEERFSAYLTEHHGLTFADVDEREIVRSVLCDVDSKNYHAWLHFTWYLHSLPFLLEPPSWTALKTFADALAREQQSWAFRVHPDWAFVTSSGDASATPVSLRSTLPPSPLTVEVDFTARLIHDDCLNNSAWCHRYSLFKQDLLRRLWRTQTQPHTFAAGGVDLREFHHVLYALCMVEADFALQWLHVDPTNESASTHARSVALLYHTLRLRMVLWKGTIGDAQQGPSADAHRVRQHLRDASLHLPVAAASLDLCADAEEGTVASASPTRDAVLSCMQRGQHHLLWSDYWESFSVLRHVQRVQHTSIRQRVAELEGQAARVLRAAAVVAATTATGAPVAAAKMTLLSTLYERSSQYMLDNFHHVDTAQYLCCQAVLEEMWLVYFTPAQREAVRQARPPTAYCSGLQSEWMVPPPWVEGEEEEQEEDEARGKEYSDEAVVAFFLRCEATALYLAKRLSVLDPIRFKYWKFEAMTTMQRGYGTAL